MKLCNTDKNWIRGIVGDPDYAEELIECIEQNRLVFIDDDTQEG